MSWFSRRLRKLHESERGTTLVELLVGMTLLSVFMAMFTGAIILMSRTANKVEAVTVSAAQVNSAFLSLDKSVRYAAAISTFARSSTSGDWHVEFDTPPQKTGNDVCTQLRVDNSRLQKRTWEVTGAGYTSLTSWIVLASNITNGATALDSPFSVPPATPGASTAFQRLTITLIASSGTGTSADTPSVMTFTAVNSSSANVTPVCQQVQVDA